KPRPPCQHSPRPACRAHGSRRGLGNAHLVARSHRRDLRRRRPRRYRPALDPLPGRTLRAPRSPSRQRVAATRALAWLGRPRPDPPVVSVDAHLSERVSLNAYRSAYPEGVIELEGATALRVPPAPSTPMLNRIVGLGLEASATE